MLLHRKSSGASKRVELGCRRKFSVSEKGVGKYVDTDCCFWGQNLNLQPSGYESNICCQSKEFPKSTEPSVSSINPFVDLKFTGEPIS